MRRAKAERYRLGLAALWVGWGLACVALLVLGLSALSDRTWSLLTLRHNQALTASEELGTALTSLERLPRLLVATAKDAADGRGLSPAKLADLRRDGQPFCQLFWLKTDGSTVLESDVRPPAWLWSLARRRSSNATQLLRPLPPGLEAGRLSQEELELSEETPESYLAAVARTAGGEVLVAQLDLSYVFGPWLKKRLERSPLAEDLQASPIPQGDLPAAPPAPSRPRLWQSQKENARWRWSEPTFFASTSQPFPPLTLSLDNAPALSSLRRELAGLAGAAAVLMAAFALSIALTGRAVKRELQYAEARARFTEMVSHELRTPLAAISMYGEILREGLIDDPDKVATYHGMLAAETERLKRLVEDVLTFGRLQGEMAEVQWRQVDPHQIARQAIAAVAPLNLDIESSIEGPGFPSDPGLLIQILVNLLENAAKHAGAENPIQLVCSCAPTSITWEVRDLGPGVPESQRAEIFQAYTRVLPSDGAKKSGVGLGLAIVEGLARCLEGRVECRPREGGGAIFALVLPRKEGSIGS